MALEANSKEIVMQKNKNSLIKLFPNEKIVLVERQHKVALLAQLFLILAIFLLCFGAFVFLFNQQIIVLSQDSVFAVFYGTLLGFSALVSLAIFVFLYWYYQFYIVTSQRLVHVHFFRLGGFHFDEVLLSSTHEGEIERHSENFLYDIFDIDDVSVHFRRTERPDRF